MSDAGDIPDGPDVPGPTSMYFIHSEIPIHFITSSHDIGIVTIILSDLFILPEHNISRLLPFAGFDTVCYPHHRSMGLTTFAGFDTAGCACHCLLIFSLFARFDTFYTNCRV